jgi:Lon protease-like protein
MMDSNDERPLPKTAPVFPLPEVVFFPHTVLPLHIFEQRYREMTANAIEKDGYIAMTLLRPDTESGESSARSYHRVGCLGRITKAIKTEDGRYYLNLTGLRKVSLGESVGETPYITARIQPIEERTPAEAREESHDELVRLLGACGVLLQELSDSSFPLVSIREGLPYETVVNSICFHLGIEPELKQSLLEENDVRRRCRRLTDLVERHLQKVVLSRDQDADAQDPELVN